MTIEHRPPPHAYAQTNLQLFNQMLAGGYSDQELDLIGRCYGLVVHLFAGHFRGNGKPFLGHLIGTASILVTIKAPAPMVGAGLVHAAYDHGDFALEFPFSRRRARVRRGTGPEVEEIIARYAGFEWTEAAIATLQETLHTLEPALQQVVVIRLANELEDSLDSGLLYCLDPKEGQMLTGPQADAVVGLARELHQPELAAALEQAVKEYHVATPPPDILRSPTTESFRTVSPSYRLRPTVRVGRTLFTLVRPVLDHLYSRVASRRPGL